MSQQSPPPSSSDQGTSADPWQAFGYLLSGVALYGVLGWLLDRWLGTTFLVAVGIVVGAGLGIYLSIRRFTIPAAPSQPARDEDPPGPRDA